MLRILLCIIGSFLVAASASAQHYPTKPVRLIVAFAPGGASDVLARLLAQRLGDSLGQSVIVDNRPSAGGIIGTDLVAKAAPDGYTLLLGSAAAFAIAPHLAIKLPYDTRRDFVPIAPFTRLTFVLSVNPRVDVRSIKDLVALGKSRPGTLNIGSAGNGTTTHMVGELFKRTAGVDLVHVPYKGAGPAMIDLISGQIQVLFDAAITTLPQLKAGRIRALAVGSPERSALFPGLPTIIEAGLPGFTAGNWFGIFAPAKVPAALVRRLNSEISNVIDTPDTREEMLRHHVEPLIMDQEKFRELVATEYERYGKLVKVAGIKIN